MGNGQYAKAKPITTKEGKPLSDNYAQSPCLGDWDGDGDYDMVLGFISGPAKLYLNNGDFTFKEAGVLTANRKPIDAHDGGPCIVDWDGDGILDLLMGDDWGNVAYYKGKERGSLDLLADENLNVLPHQKGHPGAVGSDQLKQQQNAWAPRKPDSKSKVGFSPAQPGARLKPYAADWNGDGKLDLIVGDYIQIEAASKPLRAAQKKMLVSLAKQLKKSQSDYFKESQRVQSAALKESGLKSFQNLTNDEVNKYSRAFSRLAQQDKKYQTSLNEYMALNNKIAELKPRVEGTGLVWVYLRK